MYDYTSYGLGFCLRKQKKVNILAGILLGKQEVFRHDRRANEWIRSLFFFNSVKDHK
jgi:hypothetical protein